MVLGVGIDFDFENIPLEIKTDSIRGSGEKVRVVLYDENEENAGGIAIAFGSTSTMKYKIWECTTGRIDFQTEPSTELNKIWRITLSRSSGSTSIVIDCNDEEVLNFSLSDTTCDEDDWNTYWSRNVVKIKFHSSDTASDAFQSAPGG